MIRQIIHKEILENLLSFRFILSLVLIIVLFAVGAFVFAGKYKHQSDDYWEKTNENLEGLNTNSRQLYRLAFYRQSIWRRPKPLALCADGFEKFLPNCFTFDVFSSDLPEIKGRGNFTLSRFSSIDWVFIISVILSFLAMVFTYDSVSGEKEDGTLRQMLANTIPRHQVLLGKYLGVVLTIGIPMFIGLLVCLIIVVASNVAVMSGLDWLKILAIILVSFLYLSIFILLGMFVSSRTAYPANSMVMLLLIWVVFVVLIPSFGKIISEVSGKAPNPTELERRLGEISAEMWGNSARFGERAGNWTGNVNHPMNNPPARGRLKTAEVNGKNQAREDYHNKMMAQAFIGRNLTCFSPTVIYQRTSEALAGTGINRVVSLQRQIKEYQANLKEYVRVMDAEDSLSLHLIFPETSSAQAWRTISHNPVDFDTVPKFRERDLGLGESLRLAVWDIGVLALFNLVFFTAAFVSFLRYDVR
ncbi:MAG: ABC transporter permease subunit [Planctomycetota bacterium]|jgi:ABC-type transport system involved in multi-copper enzyme maturation permease subunit